MASSVWNDNKILRKWVLKNQKKFFDGNFNFDMTDQLSDPLLEEISKKIGVDKNYIYVGAGSSQFIPTLLSLKCWNRVFLATPEFGLYTRGVSCYKDKKDIVEIPSLSCHDFVEKLANYKSSKNDFLCISSPRWFSGEKFSMEQIDTILHCFSGVILIDEAYISFSNEPDGLINLAKENERIMILRSFSKKYFLSGLRVGYLVTIRDMKDFRNTLLPPHSISTYSSRFCVALLQDEKILNIFSNTIEYMKNNRNYLYEALKDEKNLTIYASEANFITFVVANEFYYKKYSDALRGLPGIQSFHLQDVYFIKIWIADLRFSQIVVERMKGVQ